LVFVRSPAAFGLNAPLSLGFELRLKFKAPLAFGLRLLGQPVPFGLT
jgi:hypothetical protein